MNRGAIFGLAGLAAGLALGASACSGGGSSTLSGGDVLGQIPWAVPERATYRLMDGKHEIGSGVLSIEQQGQDTVFSQKFDIPKEKITDEVAVVAGAETLTPLSVSRRISGPEGDRTCQATYEGRTVTVEQKSKEGQRTDRLDVPVRSYDTWTDLFLWRTLAFAPGLEVRYTDALTCSLAKPDVLSVALKVKGRDTVEVPAGKFDAWKLEIRSGGSTQKAWYEVAPPHRLVRYDNGQLVFELEPPGD
jgi:hypothetical protein